MLYLIQVDGMSYYVEADNIREAPRVLVEDRRRRFPDCEAWAGMEGFDDIESVALIDNGPVIRDPEPTP